MKLLISLLSCFLSSYAVVVIHEGGSCGTNSVPYKMVVDAEGKPEILCDAPTCLGVDYSANGQRDRKEKLLSVSCDPFKEVVCVDELQWTGGLLEVNNGTHRTLKTECCSYDGMSNAQTIKSIFLGPGDVYEGGMVEKEGEAGGFDLIKEIRKTVNAENQVQYIVAVYRLPCNLIPDSAEALPVVSRNRRRLRDRLGNFDDAYRSYAVNYGRRPFTARRRAMLKRMEDYYDYDYEPSQFRRPLRRSRLPYAENSLWPVQYNSKPKAFSDSTYQENTAPLTTITDGSASAGNSYAETASVEVGPVPPATQYLESQNVAPVNTYQTQPVPPPVDTYQTPLAQPSYNSYPAYNAYPTANQYSGYPAQQYSAVAQPAAQSSYSYQSPYQYSYAQPNLNSVFARTPFQCFSGDMEVQTEDGTKLMRDLKVGDKVLSLDGNMLTYLPIVMFLHKRHDEEAEFNVIETEFGHSIKLTDNHLIYISNCAGSNNLRLAAAKDVTVDDCVHVMNDKEVLVKRRVHKITRVFGTGIYSPLTTTGDIVVNRVLSSCHSNLAVKALQQTFFSVYKTTTNMVSRFFTSSEEGHLPYGVETLTSVLDMFIPQSFV
ncbi:unnamed protein product [Caenorhabditis angaria]|uniref:Warthog protein 6 n=1 Tax=Caenorhabditis angaria TaxID=860376 RepID=A0A9P1J107_9PELO|nr:unnamed protein product [Caenorhabditis angaria]